MRRGSRSSRGGGGRAALLLAALGALGAASPPPALPAAALAPRAGTLPLALSPAAAAVLAQEAAVLPQEATLPAAPCPEADRAELARRLELLLGDPVLQRAHVGLVVQEAESGEVLFQRSAEKRFTAASTTKLVTAAVALHRLGPDHRWTTTLLAAGPVRDGVLAGDVWIVGGGDPTFTHREVRAWPRLLREAGVRRVRGDVVGDDRAFPGPAWGRGWMWDELYAGWGAGVSALQLWPGSTRAELLPGPAVGDPATLRAADSLPAPSIEVRVRTGDPGSDARLRFVPPPGGGPVRLEGWIPAGDTIPLDLAPSHPTLHLLAVLSRALADSGIVVEGRVRRAGEGEPVPDATWEKELPSDPLEDVLRELLRRSDNQIAESLLRSLGREAGTDGDPEGGLEAVRSTLADWGIDPGAIAMADGSGLSRYNEMTPAALARLLRRIRQLPEFETFADALPVAGESGTLARRFLATEGAGRLRAKTGSLSAVRALAGYVEDADGETLAFALLLNGYDAPGEVATAVEDLLVEQLALYHGPAYPERSCPSR